MFQVIMSRVESEPNCRFSMFWPNEAPVLNRKRRKVYFKPNIWLKLRKNDEQKLIFIPTLMDDHKLTGGISYG